MTEPCSSREAMSWKNGLAASVSNWMYPTSSIVISSVGSSSRLNYVPLPDYGLTDGNGGGQNWKLDLPTEWEAN
jgi:hypothetical protein